METPIDCLILHAPKFQNWYRAVGNYVSILPMAVGIFALADAVEAEGCKTRILHLGLEKALNPGFAVRKYLKSHPSRVVAFSVQFHQQLYDSLRAAESVKKQDPSVFVVFGGMTATFFAQDILSQFPYVDAVVVGEGEKPLAQLVKAVKDARTDLGAVPNLMWRKGGVVTLNPDRYVATQQDLDALDFVNLPLMEHFEEYVRMPKVFTRLRVPTALNWKISNILSQQSVSPVAALPVGRGCVTNCSYCGGGIAAHRLIHHRDRVVFRSSEKVVDDIRRLKEFGYEKAYFSFDPAPFSDPYYRELFARLRQQNIVFGMYFSAWSLPSRPFVEAFHQAAGPDSDIAISPETGSERLRKVVRGIYYSNDELMDAVRFAESKGVSTKIFFSLGLPREARGDFDETLRLKDRIEKQFRRAEVCVFPVEIEPAAPWYLDPDKYGIRLVRRSLSDFLAEQKQSSYSSMSSLGYYQDEYLGEPVKGPRDYAEKVLATKCRYFCDQRTMCRIAGWVWGVADFIGLSASGDVEV